MGERLCKAWPLGFDTSDFIGIDVFGGNASLQEGVPLQVKVLFVGGDPGLADEHRRVVFLPLDNRELPVSLLCFARVMQPQDGFVHDAGEEEHLVHLLFFGHSPQCIMEGNGNCGFEEFLRLFGTGHTRQIVSETRCFVKSETG